MDTSKMTRKQIQAKLRELVEVQENGVVRGWWGHARSRDGKRLVKVFIPA